MKLLDFSKLAGWPVSSSVMKFIQEQLLQLQMTSLMGGKLWIVTGCEDDGNGGITDGVVVINGDVLPFEGSELVENAKVVITDTVGFKQFFGGNGYNPFYHNRKAQFGTTGNNQTEWLWSSFKRNDPENGLLARVDRIEKMLKPLVGYSVDIEGVPTTVYGSWLFWGRPANEIPAGWEAVPDAEWKGRVPVVLDGTGGDTDFNVVGKTAGAKTMTLAKENIPELEVEIPSTGYAGIGGSAQKVVGNANTPAAAPLVFKVNKDQVAQAFSKLMPYRVVMFIRWIG